MAELEDLIRQVTATPKTAATPSTAPKSSVPTTPVNRNIPETTIDPVQAEIDRIKAERAPRATLDDTQYPTKLILTNDGRKVQVYTSNFNLPASLN